MAVITASHASAPYCEGEDCEAQRPEGPEAEDDQRDPGGFAEFVELGGDGHGQPRVNVNNIYIYGDVRGGCQHPSHSNRRADGGRKVPARAAVPPPGVPANRGRRTRVCSCLWISPNEARPEPLKIFSCGSRSRAR